ncbi:MAG: UDP-4-amino-4,6-dideoxy-N-acetyl-beta-L-altrosamine transaminase [Alphaproteobacteria bacterium]|nr:UDP-4-amino-4,6-dideoxy-N-acetyl-beta-L-altrosamine transaminase [Alphaproteobacteria bacterium]
MKKVALKDQSFIPYGQQWIDEEDIQAVNNVLKSAFLTCGPIVDQFEVALAKKVESQFAIAVSSGTAALHLCSLVLDLKPGDKVIVPSITFLATANAVKYMGADVIFADVDTETGLMSYEHYLRAYESGGNDVKAVYYVHLNGQVSDDFVKIAKDAKQKNIFIVEDAAHAIGTKHSIDDDVVKPVGSCAISDLCIFSFHPVKTITMGEGGAITTNNEHYYEKLKTLRHHGMVRDPALFTLKELAFTHEGQPYPWYYEMSEMGFNYRATDIHCALGLSQLKKLDYFVARRQEIVRLYDDAFESLTSLLRPIPKTDPNLTAFHLYPILIDFSALKKNRYQVIQELKNLGIGTQVHYMPLPLHPFYKENYRTSNIPGAMIYYSKVLSLPLYPKMRNDDVFRVIDAVRDVIRT